MSAAVSADPDVFLEIDDLELVGRGLAEAVWLGRHGGVRTGPGVEFHSHRAYQPGDDLRRINWALYARQRRLHVRESRQESRRPVHIIVDATASMAVANATHSKFHYAARAAAALAYIANGQGDAASLCLLQDRLAAALPPRTGSSQTAGICAALSATTPRGTSDLVRALGEARHICTQRGFIILISDFFDKEDALIVELAQLRAQGHDVLALQILDPMEVELPASGDYEFLDAEDGSRLKTSAEELRASHKKAVAEWRETLRTRSLAAGLRWQTTTTESPLAPILRAWLDAG